MKIMHITSMPSPNFNTRQNNAKPSLIIIHYTGMKTAQDALERLCDPKSQVSAHYTIDEDSTLYQHVDEAQRAWHAGVSQWQGITDVNSHSIGIELVNPGHEHGYRPFPTIQIEKLISLCQAIMQRHKIHWIVGHEHVAPNRKQDPGPLFPWEDLIKSGLIKPDYSTYS